MWTCVMLACSPATAPSVEPDNQTKTMVEAVPSRVLIEGPEGVDPRVQGVWERAASGWILEIGDQGVTRWQHTPAGCYRSEQGGPTAMGAIEYRYYTPLGPDRSLFEYLPEDGHAVFERLPALPEACEAPPPSGPLATFDVFTSVFAQHYAFFERRGVDWAASTNAARSQISPKTTEVELFEVFAALIEPLGDSHTKLIGEFEGEKRRVQFGLGETLPRIEAGMGEGPWLVGQVVQLGELLDPGSQHVANDRILWGSIDGRVGYIWLLTMGGFTGDPELITPEWASAELDALHGVLDEALAAFAGYEAVILDLSNNRGGYDAIARALASRFCDEPFLGYTVREDWEGEPLASYLIEPWSSGPRWTGPTYVLTSDVTVSGGEIATMMLRSLPHVTQAGGTTRGVFSTPLAKPLPNGWYLELSNEIFADGAGEVHEGRGLAPSLELDVFAVEDPVASHGQAVRALVEAPR